MKNQHRTNYEEVIRNNTSVMGLHSLERVRQKTSAFKIYIFGFGDYATLYVTSWPECMPHRAPRMLRIGSKIAFTIFAHMETWRHSCKCQIDDASFICSRLDSISVASFVQCDSTSISIERQLLVVKAVVIEGIRGKEVWGLVTGVKNLRIELARGPYTAIHCRLGQ